MLVAESAGVDWLPGDHRRFAAGQQPAGDSRDHGHADDEDEEIGDGHVGEVAERAVEPGDPGEVGHGCAD
jgi:hypothetical protein